MSHNDQRVFFVTVTTTRTIAVVACSRADAEGKSEVCVDQAEDYEDDLGATHTARAVLATRPLPDDFVNTLPYGVHNSDPRRDWTIEDWLDAARKDA